MANVKKIEAKFIPTIAKKRVAAYARVSSDKDAMLMSLSAQISYYNNYISAHNDWEFVEIYSDEGISGTKENRPGFQKMLKDCRSGKIDMVIAKSITRFARNTVILLESIRELKLLNIDVYFEKENIHTLSSDGEFMITLLASYAQEEARSASENQLWRIHKLFEKGLPNSCLFYGYRYSRNGFVIEPHEADVVREVFDLYLSGLGIMKIARILNDRNEPTRLGGLWRANRIYYMLRNEVYIGNLLLQKTYRKSFMDGTTIINHGEKPMYEVIGGHEAIVDENTFHLVQEEMARRKVINDSYATNIKGSWRDSPLISLVKCGLCGKTYRRKINSGIKVWTCSTYHDYGKKHCHAKRIRDDLLNELLLNALGFDNFNDVAVSEILREIRLNSDSKTIELHFTDDTVEVIEWRERSRSESWTDEMKKKAGAITAERHRRNRNGNR